MRNGFLGSLFLVLSGVCATPPAAAQPLLPYPQANPAQAPPVAIPQRPVPHPAPRPAPDVIPQRQMPAAPAARSIPSLMPYPEAVTPAADAPAPGRASVTAEEPPLPGADVSPKERAAPPQELHVAPAAPDVSAGEPALSPPTHPTAPQGPNVEASPNASVPLMAFAPPCPACYDEPPDRRDCCADDDLPRHGPRGLRVYGRADYLFWWIKQRAAPALLSTGPLGEPGTVVLLNGLGFDNQERVGARTTLGFWLNEMQTVGLEVSGLWLAERSPEFYSSVSPLARPYFSARLGREFASFLSRPGLQAGAAKVEALSRLWGADANARVEILRGKCYHLDLLGGFRFLEMDDGLSITDRTTFAAGTPGLGGVSLVASDRFGARNLFFGGQLGAELEVHCGRWFVDLWGKFALGNNHQIVSINGTTVIESPVLRRLALPGGLLAQPTNTGRFTNDEFCFIPEVGVNVGLRVTSHLRLSAGYTFLYMTSVVRGGDQVDRVVNIPQVRSPIVPGPGLLVGEPRPTVLFRDSDFWAQGVNVGVEFRY